MSRLPFLLWVFFLTLSGLASAEAPRFRPDAPSATPSLWGPYGLIVGLLLIGIAAYWFARRAGILRAPSRMAPDLVVKSQCRLSAKTTLYVVRHHERELLLAEHEHGITALTDNTTR